MAEKAKRINFVQLVEEKTARKPNFPQFRPGDSVRVSVKIQEGDKERIQAFEGICIRKKNNGACSSFTVRKISYGIGVERIFPVGSPMIDKIDLLQSGDVRRAKLYYLRKLRGKAAKVKVKRRSNLVAAIAPAAPVAPVEALPATPAEGSTTE